MDANLHLHSRYSDGSLWPEELAGKVAEAGIEYASLTDHDSLAGSLAFARAAAPRGFAVVPGCEVDCAAPEVDYRSEILAYFPGSSYSLTEAFLEGLAKARAERLHVYLDGARRHFKREDLSYDDLVARKYGERAFAVSPYKATLSKVDFWLYLRARGVPEAKADYRDFRKIWLDPGTLGNPRGKRTTVAEVAEVVGRDGGLLVIPHIGHEFEDSLAVLQGERKRLRRLLAHFREAGVTGVELYYYRGGDGKGLNEEVAREAEALGFFLTYGSDCHGPGSGKHTLGDFSGDFPGFPGFPPPSSPTPKE